LTEKLAVGCGCTFWHEGGRGQQRWVIGWRFGYIKEIPSKGAHFGFIRVEIPVNLWTRDNTTGKYAPAARERVWVPVIDVNEPGDTKYHGERTVEMFKERKQAKAAEQAKADKKVKAGRRFHR
jgi:hypothetical protein